MPYSTRIPPSKSGSNVWRRCRLAALTYPRIDPEIFAIGPISFRWYGLAYVLGVLVAWYLLVRVNRRWRIGLSRENTIDVALAAAIGIFLGARLGYAAVYGGDVYLRDPLKIIAIWDGGMSFHGGLVGILLAAAVMSRYLKVPFLRLCDAGAVGAPAGLLFGRLANFVNGELWGRPSDVPWAMVFPGAGALPRHPSQLYEAALEGAVLLAVMVWLARKTRPSGEMLGWFLALYSIFRVVAEFFREPDEQLGFLFGPVTMGQLLSVPMLLLGAWLIWRARTGAKDEPEP